MSFSLTDKQQRALAKLGGPALHVMLYGGSRSGKTFLIVRSTVARALAHRSRHAMLRYRFNHLKASIIYDTLPKVMELCYPGVADHSKLDKSDWFYAVPVGQFQPSGNQWSEIYFGGLDEKERTEKILGQEYATMFLNECSQIGWAARNMAMTRLAQKTELRLRAWYDCNPPSAAHWTYKVFTSKEDPDTRRALANPDNYDSIIMNPGDNRANLAPEYIAELEALPERQRRRFLLGQFSDIAENALWTIEGLDAARYLDERPTMVRIVVAVDPSGVAGEEDTRSDEVGIVVVGLGVDGLGYVLEDLSGRRRPAEWAKVAVDAYERWEANCIVAEVNFGAGLVELGVKAANSNVPVKEVRASRGKVIRADPFSAMFEQGKVRLAGHFPELEDQLCAMTTAGYMGSRSPDRADAMVWGLAELFPKIARGANDNMHRERPSSANMGGGGRRRRRR